MNKHSIAFVNNLLNKKIIDIFLEFELVLKNYTIYKIFMKLIVILCHLIFKILNFFFFGDDTFMERNEIVM